ncbi:MAG: malto-oligosyltrehalose synthase [Burkholderiales bacterium]|nr:malto-oligosyltrehalose synthase [Burkholderiales bacterium]
MSTKRASRRKTPNGSRMPIVPLASTAIPRATYRIQLHRDFGFAQVTARVPYLAALGISHVYCSPYLKARPGSRHGYDIVDHHVLNPELGGREEFDRMTDALARHGMSHLCDVVPNHMAIMGSDNAWWLDVLENGPASTHAGYFDIDWMPQDADLAGKVLVPVLGEPYGTVLDHDELDLGFDPTTGGFAIVYFENRFPLDPATYPSVLEPALAGARATLDPTAAAEAERLIMELQALPARDDPAPERIAQRQLAIGPLKTQLAELAARHPVLAAAITDAVERFSATAGDTERIDALHTLLEAQAYRLAYWRVASDEINYRRFFDVNDLAALRMESDEVFEATHGFILDLAASGVIGGLRIDHPDGLFDPARYFAQLQQRYRERSGDSAHGIYVVVEKIRAPHERIPETWQVHGTTGYQYANLLNGLFVDTRAKARVDRVWRAFVGDEAETFEHEAHRGRHAIMDGALASELAVLTQRALRIARADRRTRDFTFNALREAIKEIVAQFPIYRSYIDAGGASAQDRRYIEWAVSRARARSRLSDARIFDFLHSALQGVPPEGAPAMQERYREFAMRVQQFTAPVNAKGVEDTAFYTFNRLVSLNEVGGDPEHFGVSVRAFHAVGADLAVTWPQTMLASSTHDNKRSEDVRARIDVISEMPAPWRLLVRRWSRINRSRKRVVDDRPAPSRNDEYLLYQTLVGTFPPDAPDDDALAAYRERIENYMVKAAREAKVHTSWLAVNPAYEEALTGFVAALLRGPGENLFLAELRSQLALFTWFGMLNSLSMMLLKLSLPGVPDIYQGNEMLDWSLVDPDNRRPVDYASRQACVESLAGIARGLEVDRSAQLSSLFASPYDGRAKLWVVLRALALRREHPELFAHGGYRRVDVAGAHGDHVVAFARTHGRGGVVVVSGRMFATLGPAVGELPVGDAWGDTTLDLAFLVPGTRLTNVLTGESFASVQPDAAIAKLCADFPGALLHYTLPDEAAVPD